ncbi:MAG: hypothetical protein ACI3XG_06840 [Faecousia sp.]
MYQGKFDAKSRGQQAPDEALDNIIREREEDNALRAAKKAQREARRSASPGASGAPRSAKPAAQKAPAQRPAQKKPAPARPAPERSAKKQTEVEVVRQQRRGPRLGGIIFYTIYFMMIFVFFIGVFITLNWLNGWLKDYEAAQPTVKCQQVFDQLFGNPDWSQLYRLAGDPTGTGTNKYDTQFEGVDEYVSYMEEKVAGQELNYVETSAGISGNKKYIVRLGTEKVATFTLNGHGEKITDIPDWQLGEVEIFINRQESIKIRKLENHVAYINNNPLDDSYTIQIASTKADENQAPENRVRTSIQEVSGLLTTPELVVYDQTGAPIEVRYNPDSGMYEEQTDAIAMTEEERTAVFGALEAYAGFMINASGSRANLAKYFDGGSTTYNDIIKMGSELWMNADYGHTFLNEEILGYTKHSATLFSVRASMTMHVKCKDGSEKDYDVIQSMYFSYKNDKWVCTEMTNEDITAPVGEVRLTFCDAAGNTISSEFYSTDALSLTAPIVEAPAGKVFSGWCTVETNEQGQKTWNMMFQPDETGTVYFSSGYSLVPMVLYPLFTTP